MEYNTSQALAWSRMGSRHTFGSAVTQLAEEYPDFMVIAADTADSAGLTEFSVKYPNRFLNVGIAEQNMIGIASGLAKEGFRVFAVTFAPFASMRCFEAVRSYPGYMHLDVAVVGLASGLSMGVGGNTHYGLEDVALMRTIPGLTIISPADCTETVKSTEALIIDPGPAYMRLTGVNGNPTVFKEDYTYNIGKGIVLRQGNDVAVIAAGTMVNEAIRATRLLQKQQLSASVVDMHTVKPLDTELIDELFSSHKMIVTIEEHSVIGGLGSAVAEYKAKKDHKTKLLILGLPDKFRKAGSYQYMLEKNRLTATHIAQDILDNYPYLGGA